MGLDSNYFKVPGILGLTDHGFQVILFDQRGNGLSEEEDESKLTIAQWASDIDLVSNTLQLDDFILLGHSYGGMIAIKYASQNPPRLKKLILVGTPSYSKSSLNDPNTQLPKFKSDDALKEHTELSWSAWFPSKSKLKRTLGKFLSKTGFTNLAQIVSGVRYREILKRINCKVAPYLAGKRELIHFDGRPKLTKISTPTLLIVGKNDKNFIERNHQMKDIIPDATLNILDHAGHFPFINKPRKFKQIICKFGGKHTLIEINGEIIRLEYTKPDGVHVLGLWAKPFEAINSDKKKIENRVNVPHINFDYSTIKSGDKVLFINEETGEVLDRTVKRNAHYKSIRKMYEQEGLKISSATPRTIAEGIDALEKHTGYKEAVLKNGIFAIELSK
jgi:proline iminopeptidase